MLYNDIHQALLFLVKVRINCHYLEMHNLMVFYPEITIITAFSFCARHRKPLIQNVNSGNITEIFCDFSAVSPDKMPG
jgi:hypothetical protein